MNIRSMKSCGVLLAAALLPLAAQAEQGTAVGGGTISAPARVNLQVNVQRFLRFRVGSAAALDTVVFDVTAANGGSGTDVTATSGGDVAVGQLTAEVTSNGGQVTISEANNGAGLGLSDGGGNFIPYTEILTTSGSGNLPAPSLSNLGANTAVPVLGVDAGIGCLLLCTRRATTWTYTYDNAGLYAGATYTGQVTYTASTP